MKKSNYVLLLTLLLASVFSLPTFAQTKTLSISLERAPISQLIKEVESQTDFTFFINDDRIDVKTLITLNVKNASLKKVLETAFSNTLYDFEIINKQILLRSKEKTIAPQNITVSGIVSDSNNEPVVGATVTVKGTLIATMTDVDGNFTITVPDNNSQLIFSYVGFVQIAVAVKNKTQFNITMEENTKMLDEIVVVGYGTQNKKTLTGSVSSIKMGDTQVNTLASASHALAGKAAGLRVNMVSAQPGGASKFRIRGEGSDQSSNEPLIVIDGFPINASGSLGSGNDYNAGQTDNILESLNPDDIESISVLKDAASTAIYGARAGHGVILITTKRGTEKKATVTYSGNIATHRIANNYKMLDGRQFKDMKNRQKYEEYLKTNGLGIYAGYGTATNPNPDPFKPDYTNDEILRAETTDWLGAVSRTGYMQQHNLSIAGGSTSSQYLLSLNYMKQAGVVKNNDASRFSVRLNMDQKLSEYVKVGITATYAQNKYDNVPLGDGVLESSGILTAAVQANPTLPIRDSEGNYTLDPLRSYVPNTVSLLEIFDQTVKDRIMGLGYIKVTPIKELEFKLNLGADRKFQKRINYLPKSTLLGFNDNSSAVIQQMTGVDYLMDATVTYNKTFNEIHKLTVLGGYSYQQFNNEWVKAGSKDYVTDALGPNDLNAGVLGKTVGSSKSKSAVTSYFGRIHYNLMSRYLVEGTLRMDGQSNFHPDHRWGTFTSVSAGWIVSEETFMASTRSWLSNLKLRASYGQTGNSNLGGSYVSDQFQYGSPSILGTSGTEIKGIELANLGNKTITWEKTTELNFGLDASFIKGRFEIAAEYYDRKISDLLTWIPLMSYNEVSGMYGNGGATRGKGVEVTLNTTNITTKNFEWRTTLTLNKYTDRWDERTIYWKPNPYERVNDYMRSSFTWKAQGIMQPGETAPAAQPDLLPGMMKLADISGPDGEPDGKLDDYDKVYQGNPSPDLIFGFNNSFRYKAFDLNIYFYGELGRVRDASYYYEWTTMKDNVNVTTHAYESFNHNNLTSKHPTFLLTTDGWGDYYMKKINYLRCGNITLGYTIPIDKKIAKSVRVYATATNPFVLTNWNGLDPETDNGRSPYPNIRAYNFGVNITF